MKLVARPHEKFKIVSKLLLAIKATYNVVRVLPFIVLNPNLGGVVFP